MKKLINIIKKIITNKFKIKDIKKKKKINIDSLEKIELIMILEEKFNIEIEDYEAKNLNTLKKITKLVFKKINKISHEKK
ncbi:phosphopantetheine-binding protein [Buchnera aphidicola (Ceratoglyphina bambusae)]|uniref:hypothetical protein n=1 Tax=Buchnera aphidicola TaxID=9 RepID=UPI0031B889FD